MPNDSTALRRSTTLAPYTSDSHASVLPQSSLGSGSDYTVFVDHLGVPCLGGPAVPPSVIAQGNAACEAVRPAIESAYRDAGRATSNLAVGAAFDQLAGAWTGFSRSIGGLPLSAAPRLRPVRGDAVRSSRRAGELAAQLAADRQQQARQGRPWP